MDLGDSRTYLFILRVISEISHLIILPINYKSYIHLYSYGKTNKGRAAKQKLNSVLVI